MPAARAQAVGDLDQEAALAVAAGAVEKADGAGGAVRGLAPGEEVGGGGLAGGVEGDDGVVRARSRSRASFLGEDAGAGGEEEAGLELGQRRDGGVGDAGDVAAELEEGGEGLGQELVEEGAVGEDGAVHAGDERLGEAAALAHRGRPGLLLARAGRRRADPGRRRQCALRCGQGRIRFDREGGRPAEIAQHPLDRRPDRGEAGLATMVLGDVLAQRLLGLGGDQAAEVRALRTVEQHLQAVGGLAGGQAAEHAHGRGGAVERDVAPGSAHGEGEDSRRSIAAKPACISARSCSCDWRRARHLALHAGQSALHPRVSPARSSPTSPRRAKSCHSAASSTTTRTPPSPCTDPHLRAQRSDLAVEAGYLLGRGLGLVVGRAPGTERVVELGEHRAPSASRLELHQLGVEAVGGRGHHRRLAAHPRLQQHVVPPEGAQMGQRLLGMGHVEVAAVVLVDEVAAPRRREVGVVDPDGREGSPCRPASAARS